MALPGMTQLNDSPSHRGALREADLDRHNAERAPSPAEASSEIGADDDYPRMPRRRKRQPPRRQPDIASGVIWWSVMPLLVIGGVWLVRVMFFWVSK